MPLVDALLSPLHYGFMQRGLVEAILTGALCGVLGTYVVLRGMAFLGNAMANAVFPGIVIAYLMHVDVLLGGLASGILVALGIGGVSQNRRLRTDSAIGVLFVGAFALGVVLISSIRAYTRDLASILLGDILGVTRQDVVLTVATGCLVLLALYFFHKELVLMSFDREMAVAMGLPVGHLEIGLLLLLSLVIIVSIQAVGTVLVLAMLITPAATARLLTDRLTTMMALAAGLGILAGVVGLYASFYVNLASGGSIVLVATAFFFLTWLFSPRYGVFRRHTRFAVSPSGGAPAQTPR